MTPGLRQSAPRFCRLWDNALGLTLAALVVLSAVPLAGNRPAWWLMGTALIAGLGAVHRLVVLSRACPRPDLSWKPWALLLALLIVPGFALLQSVLPDPLGQGRVALVPSAARIGALRFLGYLVLVLLTVELSARRRRADWMAAVLCLGVAAQGVWALIALRDLGDTGLMTKVDYLGMATGTFVNRNSLATFLGQGLMLGLAALVRPYRRGPFSALGPLLCLVPTALALLATQSRLGIAATLCGLCVTMALLRQPGRIRPLHLLAGLAGLALLSLWLSGPGVLDRALFSGPDARQRLALYAQVGQMIAQRPWTGYGLDSFAPAFEPFRAPPLTDGVTYDMAHNTYLSLWAELGIVFGSIPPLVLGLTALIVLCRLRSGLGSRRHAAAAMGALTLAALHSLGDFSFEIPANVYLLAMILGLGLARPDLPEAGDRTSPARRAR